MTHEKIYISEYALNEMMKKFQQKYYEAGDEIEVVINDREILRIKVEETPKHIKIKFKKNNK